MLEKNENKCYISVICCNVHWCLATLTEGKKSLKLLKLEVLQRKYTANLLIYHLGTLLNAHSSSK